MSVKIQFTVLLFIAFAFSETHASQVATMEGIGPVKIGMTVKK